MQNELTPSELTNNELVMLDALAYFTRRIMYVGTANINKNDVAAPQNKTYLK